VIRRVQADPDMRGIVLTTEEEGVALAAGAWLGGERAVLLMQSSGVGNCVNMLSLLQSGDFPFVTLVTMRGEYAEFNPWQCPMGRATQGALELMGLAVHGASTADEVEDVVGAALDAAFRGGQRVAVLLSQRPDRTQAVGGEMTERGMTGRETDADRETRGIDRREFGAPAAGLPRGAGGHLDWARRATDAFAAGDRDRTFYLWARWAAPPRWRWASRSRSRRARCWS
jgi:sulfopyruvate decarboxylase TPP-binding subunit